MHNSKYFNVFLEREQKIKGEYYFLFVQCNKIGESIKLGGIQMRYEEPNLDVVVFSLEDVISTSDGTQSGTNNGTGSGGSVIDPGEEEGGGWT